MLADLIREGFGITEDYSCAEKILHGANKVYHLGLDAKSLKMSAGFGGGMAIGSFCGAISSSIMVLGIFFVEQRSHESLKIKEIEKEFIDTFKKEMGFINCQFLKPIYFEDRRCIATVGKAAEILDNILKREGKLPQQC